MCGIAGWVAFGRDLRTAGPVLRAMTGTLRPRGPDDEGFWFGESAALGHTRLAVIDPPGGRQPMIVETPGGPMIIVYSGEVYNFADLRDELRRRGHRFSTASDTEVVLRGFVEWADELPARLNGMFAFAIWDVRRRTLTMIRDRLGVKPLYYSSTADGVLFASEPKAILAHPQACRVVGVDGLRNALAYAMTIPGVAWAGMHEVEPGSIVTVRRSGTSTRTYWRLSTCDHPDDRRTTVRRIRGLLEHTVQRQLVSDVPLGVLLSGGLDSSTLTAIAARSRAPRGEATGPREPLDTYDVGLGGYADHFVADSERAAPDAPFVAEMVAHVQARHRTIALGASAVAAADVRRAVVRAYDVPPGFGDRDRSMYLLFRAVRETSTVVMSGEAADELFGGYSWFHDPAVQRAPAFPWVTAGYGTYGLAPGALDPDLDAALDVPGYLADHYATVAAGVEHPAAASTSERQMRTAIHVHLTQSLRVLLDRKDRLSMATGLEVRVPYCDHGLIEYVYNTPWSLKSFDGREKSLLRAAAGDLLPSSVLARVKTAYPSMRDPHYISSLREQVRALRADHAHPVFAVVRHPWLGEVARSNLLATSAQHRNTAEWILNLAAWLEVTRPEVQLP